MKNRVIVISREYASGGREVGRLTAEYLGIPFYDKQLLIEAARRHSYNIDTLSAFDEKTNKSLLYNLALASENFYSFGAEDPFYKVHDVMEKTIAALAEEGPCVIIGRCADYALEKSKKALLLSVFIYASSMEDKIRRAGQADGIPAARAKSYIAKVDKQREEYYRSVTSRQWGDRSNYDVMIDSSVFGYSGCARIIKDIYQGF